MAVFPSAAGYLLMCFTTPAPSSRSNRSAITGRRSSGPRRPSLHHRGPESPWQTRRPPPRTARSWAPPPAPLVVYTRADPHRCSWDRSAGSAAEICPNRSHHGCPSSSPWPLRARGQWFRGLARRILHERRGPEPPTRNVPTTTTLAAASSTRMNSRGPLADWATMPFTRAFSYSIPTPLGAGFAGE